MISSADTKIFVAEFDDDAKAILGKDISESSFLAYLLLGKDIIYHPAYGFQNLKSGELILEIGNRLIKPPLVQIVLGDSKSVEEYMPERKAKLENAALLYKIQIRELEQYNRFPEDKLKEKCVILDNIFTANGCVFPIGWSRDAKFRQLVRQELLRPSQFSSGLSSLIQTLAPPYSVQKVKNEIITLTLDQSKLVSCDTITAILTDNGFNPNKLQYFKRRLRLLHWKAMDGEDIHIPPLSKHYENKMDPYDPEIFWQTVKLLIGEEHVEAFMSFSWHDRICGCLELRNNPTWEKFVSTYHGIIDIATEEIYGLDKDAVTKAILESYPTKFKYILNKLNRLDLAMLAVSMSATTLSFLLYPINVIKPIGLVVGIYSLSKVLRRWKEASKKYTESDREDLRYSFRSLLRKFGIK